MSKLMSKLRFLAFFRQNSVSGYESHESTNFPYARTTCTWKSITLSAQTIKLQKSFGQTLTEMSASGCGLVWRPRTVAQWVSVSGTHSGPSGTAAHMMSPVTRPSAPWSLTWSKHTSPEHTLHTLNLLPHRTGRHSGEGRASYPAVCWLVRKRTLTSSWMCFTRLRALKKSWEIERHLSILGAARVAGLCQTKKATMALVWFSEVTDHAMRIDSWSLLVLFHMLNYWLAHHILWRRVGKGRRLNPRGESENNSRDALICIPPSSGRTWEDSLCDFIKEPTLGQRLPQWWGHPETLAVWPFPHLTAGTLRGRPEQPELSAPACDWGERDNLIHCCTLISAWRQLFSPCGILI